MSEVEVLINLAQQTSNPEWASAHALTAIALLLKEHLDGR